MVVLVDLDLSVMLVWHENLTVSFRTSWFVRSNVPYYGNC